MWYYLVLALIFCIVLSKKRLSDYNAPNGNCEKLWYCSEVVLPETFPLRHWWLSFDNYNNDYNESYDSFKIYFWTTYFGS